jgi:hypothetical protein
MFKNFLNMNSPPGVLCGKQSQRDTRRRPGGFNPGMLAEIPEGYEAEVKKL